SIPAAIGRQLAHTFSGFISMSISAGLLSVVLGLAVARYYGLDVGPTIVTVAAGLFILSLLKKRK
ncbi:MAG: metal ABC transporter permease, partial [Patescibacteria group bacterium]